MQPELERNKLEFDEFCKGAELLHDSSRNVQATAEVMDRTTARPERMMEAELASDR